MKFGPLFIALCLLAIGCKKGPVTKLTAAPPAQLPGGWTLHEVAEDGFSIAAPEHFRTDPGLDVEMVAPSAAQSYGIEPMNDSAIQTMETLKNGRDPVAEARAKGFALVLYDRNTRVIPGEERTKIQIKKEVTGGSTLKDAADELKRSLGTVKSRETLPMPFGNVEEMVSETTTTGGDQVREIYYVIVNDTDVYRIRMNATNQPGAFDSTAREIVATFRDK